MKKRFYLQATIGESKKVLTIDGRWSGYLSHAAAWASRMDAHKWLQKNMLTLLDNDYIKSVQVVQL